MTQATIDWDELLRLYEDGTHGARELARMFNTSESTIRSRAKARGITAAQRRVVVAERIQKVLDAEAAARAADPGVKLTADAVESALVKAGADVVRMHQSLIQRGVDGVELMLEEMARETGPLDARAKTAQALSVALKNLVGLQRQAWNLPSNVTPEGTPTSASELGALLDEIDGADSGLGS